MFLFCYLIYIAKFADVNNIEVSIIKLIHYGRRKQIKV